MTFEHIAKIVSQGSLNYYSKGVEIICESAVGMCHVSLYINKTLKEQVTVGHTDPNLYFEMIKQSVETLKSKAFL